MKRSNTRIVLTGVAGLVVGALTVPAVVGANARRGTGGSQQDQAMAEQTFTAVLSGANEVSGGSTVGTGAATITVDRVAGTVCVDSVTVDVDEIHNANGVLVDPVILTHIHKGAVGANGPVVIDFDPQSKSALSKCVTPASPATIGELLADPAGFYFNVHTTGFPSGAVRGNFVAHAPGAGALHMLAEPLRAYDSRVEGPRLPGFDSPRINAGETRKVNLWFGKNGAGASKVAVPPGATGALVTLTITDTVGAGFLKLYSAGLAAAPPTSAINWSATGQIVATTTSVAVSATNDVSITAGPQATHVIVDVLGYYF